MWADSADIDSSRADRMIGVWLRFDYSRPQPAPDNPKETYTQVFTNLAIDCHAETVRNISARLVAPSGRPIPMSPFKPSEVNATFSTHPFGRGTFIGLCAWLKVQDKFPPVIMDTSVDAH